MPLECILLNITLRDLPRKCEKKCGKCEKMRIAFSPPPCPVGGGCPGACIKVPVAYQINRTGYRGQQMAESPETKRLPAAIRQSYWLQAHSRRLGHQPQHSATSSGHVHEEMRCAVDCVHCTRSACGVCDGRQPLPQRPAHRAPLPLAFCPPPRQCAVLSPAAMCALPQNAPLPLAQRSAMPHCLTTGRSLESTQR